MVSKVDVNPGSGEDAACETGRSSLSSVLWIAPNLNHYKIQFLNALEAHPQIQLRVLAGAELSQAGHRSAGECQFSSRVLKADKSNFAFRLSTYRGILGELRKHHYQSVVVPNEKKLLSVYLFLFVLRLFFGFRIVTYCHQSLRQNNGRITRTDRFLTRWLFRRYDRVVFYTEAAMRLAIEEKTVSEHVASYANNTLDTRKIASHAISDLSSKLKHPLTFLFIGRLIDSKLVDFFVRHAKAIRDRVPTARFFVIGDGPESNPLKALDRELEAGCQWLGAITEESEIAKFMNQSHFVFVPGDSGLSVVHAFGYGVPYLTFKNPVKGHGPEIGYLLDLENGMLLSRDIEENVSVLVGLFSDPEKYLAMCEAAREKAAELSQENWVEQMAANLITTANEESDR